MTIHKKILPECRKLRCSWGCWACSVQWGVYEKLFRPYQGFHLTLAMFRLVALTVVYTHVYHETGSARHILVTDVACKRLVLRFLDQLVAFCYHLSSALWLDVVVVRRLVLKHSRTLSARQLAPPDSFPPSLLQLQERFIWKLSRIRTHGNTHLLLI